VGHLKVQRDWGFAPDYVEGMVKIMRQVKVRAEMRGEIQPDNGRSYRDYVLATGKTHAVWQLIDCAFTIAGFGLDWDFSGDHPAAWRGYLRGTTTVAVTVNPKLLRAAEPLVLRVDPGRAEQELGWAPQQGLTVFLEDMLKNAPRQVPVEGIATA
jgi:GDPmannose 4,6-dehydratase